jgi:hypothetical protein
MVMGSCSIALNGRLILKAKARTLDEPTAYAPVGFRTMTRKAHTYIV